MQGKIPHLCNQIKLESLGKVLLCFYGLINPASLNPMRISRRKRMLMNLLWSNVMIMLWMRKTKKRLRKDSLNLLKI